MKALIAAMGSHGDVLPIIAIGREMSARGHEVVFFANPHFRDYVIDAGFRFVPIGTLDEYISNSSDFTKSNFKKSKRSPHYIDICLDYYHAMRAEIVAGQTIAISSNPFLCDAPHLLKETNDIKYAGIYIAPNAFWSNFKPARLTPHWWIDADTPMLLKRAAWWTINKFYLDPNFTKPLNKVRAELGLRPLAHMFHSWVYEADCVLAMFPEWFGLPQVDWPANAILTGFPLDNKKHSPLPRQLLEFIEAGPAPVAFSVGTARAKNFFETSVAACRLVGVRGILISDFAEQIPKPLPADIVHVEYAPYEALLPKLGAFVHHGGIGSTSQALRAGVPQLIRPVAYDQFDNSSRAVQLGVARELLPEQYSVRSVADALTRLMSDDQVRKQCRAIASRFTTSNNNAIQVACDAIVSRCSLGAGLAPEPRIPC
ncbi:MAG: glycosyltransferase [Burkholderiaceae bacterium]|jgi:UDP:flavonoid glycosyltransferase YjiC (YdhE family)|nr:glycosyltransferase [Burkholderiaceae bacterium]